MPLEVVIGDWIFITLTWFLTFKWFLLGLNEVWYPEFCFLLWSVHFALSCPKTVAKMYM